jgi:hypothetical protein
MSIDKASEEDFNAWLDSIEFVDEDGIVIDYELEADESPDPEGDRS